MPPWVAEVVRLLWWGSSTGWFGLGCPAHCSSSLPLLLSVFVSGFCLGAFLLLVLVWTFRYSLFQPLDFAPTPSRRSPTSRLAGYLHERSARSDWNRSCHRLRASCSRWFLGIGSGSAWFRGPWAFHWSCFRSRWIYLGSGFRTSSCYSSGHSGPCSFGGRSPFSCSYQLLHHQLSRGGCRAHSGSWFLLGSLLSFGFGFSSGYRTPGSTGLGGWTLG